jgi:acyl dehydratase
VIARSHIGHALPAFTVPVEAGRLRFFAKATGQTDPVYVDEAAARDAGHPGLPVPPTFFFCLEMDAPDPAVMRNLLGIDYRRILHGEQQFRYHAMAHAGDRLRFEPRIADTSTTRRVARSSSSSARPGSPTSRAIWSPN